MIRFISRKITFGATYTGISFYNALIEAYTALKSMGLFLMWLLDFCTYEVEVADEDGNIIHHFPQINHEDDDDF